MNKGTDLIIFGEAARIASRVIEMKPAKMGKTQVLLLIQVVIVLYSCLDLNILLILLGYKISILGDKSITPKSEWKIID